MPKGNKKSKKANKKKAPNVSYYLSITSFKLKSIFTFNFKIQNFNNFNLFKNHRKRKRTQGMWR